MPAELKFGNHSNSLKFVVQAFEAEVGLPLSTDADTDWLQQVLAKFNEKHNTDVGYAGENYGYLFRCNTPDEAQLLGELREKNDLTPS